MKIEILVNVIRSRIFELEQSLSRETRTSARVSLREAIENNVAWLISLGYKVEG
jgi:hypothetical protein